MTARLVTVCNQKGGCGKTNVAMTLGGGLGARGLRVLVVDGDPQGTATRWYSTSPEARPFPAVVISLAETRNQIARAIKAHIDNYDVVIVDCPPSLESPITLSTLVVADLALVPTIPSPGDLWATSRLVGLVEQAKTMNPDLEVRLMPNMVQGTALAQAALDALKEIPLPVSATWFSLRTAYRQAQAEGATVLALRDPRAIEESERLVDEVLLLLRLSAPSQRPALTLSSAMAATASGGADGPKQLAKKAAPKKAAPKKAAPKKAAPKKAAPKNAAPKNAAPKKAAPKKAAPKSRLLPKAPARPLPLERAPKKAPAA